MNLNEDEKKIFENIKDSALIISETLNILVKAIEGNDIKISELSSPIILLKNELDKNIINKVDAILEL